MVTLYTFAHNYFQDSAAERAESIFGALDFDGETESTDNMLTLCLGDGSLTEDEFIQGCMMDQDLVRSQKKPRRFAF